MYLTFEEYQNYGGTLSETAFNGVIYDAQIKIDYYTFNRLINDTEIGDKVKRATYKIIELIRDYNNYMDKVKDMDKPIVKSSSNDGVSQTYGGYAGNTSMNDIKALSDKLDKDIYVAIRQYLNGERNQKGEVLLYRGVYK